jgi:hypothetical protein
VAVGGDPITAVVALPGTESTMEWWDDFHWDLVPFTQVPNGGNVAQGFYDIYNSIGAMSPGDPHPYAVGHMSFIRAFISSSVISPGSLDRTSGRGPCHGDPPVIHRAPFQKALAARPPPAAA